MSVNIGVIAVGGKGTRLGRSDIQKCLVQIEGKPILEYTIEAFLETGVKMIFLLTGFLHEQIDAYLASREQEENPTLLSVFGGTDGEIAAVLKLQHFLKEDFLYAGGDCIFPSGTTERLIQDAAKHASDIAIMAANPFPEMVPAHPRIDLFTRSKRIKRIYSPDSVGVPKLTGMGLYYFRPTIFGILAKVAPNSRHISDFVEYAVVEQKNISVSVTNHPWFCVHTAEDLSAWQDSAMRKFLKF